MFTCVEEPPQSLGKVSANTGSCWGDISYLEFGFYQIHQNKVLRKKKKAVLQAERKEMQDGL